MLIRGFCSLYQNHIFTKTTLHHATATPRPRYHMVLREFRVNSILRKPPRVRNLQTTPFESVSVEGGSVPPINVLKALAFTGAFTVGCFMGATILEYENTRNMMLERARRTRLSWLFRQQTDSGDDYWKNVKKELKILWDQLTPGQRMFVPLCALNLLVFGLWRVPSLRSTMMTYFASNPAARVVCWPMFFSTFSHYSALHLMANMYVLQSFANISVQTLGKEQFLAVYMSAGVFASLTGILYKALTSRTGMSIGASGAIMAILAYVCAKYPDTQLSIIFLPMLPIPAGAAIKIIMGADLAGCIMGWKFFDHAAHLGGALFGLFWVYFGPEMWQKRIPFLTMYHDWRKQK